MEQELIDCFEKYGLDYTPINNLESLTKIHNLFLNDVMFNPMNAVEYGHIGLYYDVHDKIKEMKFHYKCAIDLGDVDSMHNLAFHYQLQNKESKIIKYYKMAIEHGDMESISELTNYYYNKKVKCDEMVELLKTTIEKEKDNEKNYNYVNEFMFKLGHWYSEIDDYDFMKKYYEMAAKRNHVSSIMNLGEYYYRNKMRFQLMKFYIKFPDIIIREKVYIIINTIIKSKLCDTKFLKLLIKCKISEKDNFFNGVGILLNCIKNDMIC